MNQDASTVLHSELADKLRQVGSEIMQPLPLPPLDVSEDMEFPKSEFVDDGPGFDLPNLPQVSVVGDVHPSVWSGLEEFTRLQEQLSRKEKDYIAAKAHTKKRLKRIRV